LEMRGSTLGSFKSRYPFGSMSDHGKFDEYTEADVLDMLRDVTAFLSTHLSQGAQQNG